MRDFSKPRTYILSAYRSDQGEHTNQIAHANLVCDLALEGVTFRDAEGCYRGAREACVVIYGAQHERVVKRLAFENNQETYLVVAEHDRTTYLVDTETERHVCLGKLRNVGQAEPVDAEGWTFVDGHYFVASGGGTDLQGGF